MWILVQNCGMLNSKSWTESQQIKLSSQMCVSKKNLIYLKIWVCIFIRFQVIFCIHIHRWHTHLQTHCRSTHIHNIETALAAQLTSRGSVALLDQCNINVRTVLRSGVRSPANPPPPTLHFHRHTHTHKVEVRCNEVS